LSACFFKYIFNCFTEPSIAKYEASIFEKSVLSFGADDGSSFFFPTSSLYFAFKSSYFLRRCSIFSTINLKSATLSSSSSLSLSLSLLLPSLISASLDISLPLPVLSSDFLEEEEVKNPKPTFSSNEVFFSFTGGSSGVASGAGAGAAAAAAGSGVAGSGSGSGSGAAAGAGAGAEEDVIPSFCRKDWSSFLGASVAPMSVVASTSDEAGAGAGAGAGSEEVIPSFCKSVGELSVAAASAGAAAAGTVSPPPKIPERNPPPPLPLLPLLPFAPTSAPPFCGCLLCSFEYWLVILETLGIVAILL
jgi:hypothetical protein